MYKKVLNVVCCLALMAVVMLFSAVPVFAEEQESGSNVEEYPIWVGNSRVTSENAEDVFGDGTVKLEIADGKYTLTLNNADISQTSSYEWAGSTCIANILGVQNDLDLTIILIGENRLSNAEWSILLLDRTYRSKLTLCGDGSLTVNTIDSGPYFAQLKKSLVVYGELYIKKTTIKLEGHVTTNSRKCDITGSYLEADHIMASQLTVTDSIVNVFGNLVESDLFDEGANLGGLSVKGKSHVVFAGKSCAVSADSFTYEDGNELLEPEGGTVKPYNHGVTTAIYESETADAPALKVVMGQHFWKWIVDQEATCSAEGRKHEECSVCHAKRNENTSIPMTEHEWVFQGFTWFGDEKDGYTGAQADYECAGCGTSGADYFEKYRMSTAVTEPTCKEQGYTTYTVKTEKTWSMDGEEHSDSRNADYTPVSDKHTLVHTAEETGTCVKEGTREYWTCTICGKLFSDKDGGNEISQPEKYYGDHDWEAKSLSFDDNGNAEVTLVCVNDPGHSRNAEAEVLDVRVDFPTRSKDGTITYTVSYDVDGQECTGEIPAAFPRAGGDIRYTYEGKPAVWTKGSGQTAELRISRSEFDKYTFDLFTGIKVDGVEVEESSYKKERGSIIITLSSGYLETLAAGDRLVTAEFMDGDAETVLTVREEYALVGFATSDCTKLSDNYLKYDPGTEYVLPTLEEAEKIAGIDLGDGKLDYWQIWKFRPGEEENRTLKEQWSKKDGTAVCEKGKPGKTVILDTDIVLVPVFKKAITPVTGVEDHAALYGCLMLVSLLSIAALLLYRKRTIG